MKISIAVPSRNYGHYLPACLESIRDQTHADLEVLIADGGSTDDSLAIAERFAAADQRFRIISRSDRGQADAVQKAFEQSTGEVFGYLNADDTYLRGDALALVVAAFASSPAPDLVSFGGHYIDGSGRIIRPVRLRRHPADSLERIRFRNSVLQPGSFWRRHVQQELPFRVDFHYVFDAMFFYEAAQRFRWHEYETPIAGYRLHGHNKSLGVRADRVRELAGFEALKFGRASFRARYASGIACLIEQLDSHAPLRHLKGLARIAINCASYATAHRLPGI